MIIFDLDGTLWDSTKEVADSWNVIIEERTGEADKLTADDISAVMGSTMTQIADKLFGYLPEDERYSLAHECEVYENDYIRDHGARLFPGVIEIVEKLLADGVKMAVVSNCQKDYVAAFIEAMTQASEELGLDASVAEKLATATVEGTAVLLRETGQGAIQTRLDVCSPGGTTLAALNAMENAGYSKSIMAGVHAAAARSKELSQ